MIEGTEAVAAPAAGAAALDALLVLPPGINPANAAHPLIMNREDAVKTNLRNLGTIHTSEVMQELEVSGHFPLF